MRTSAPAVPRVPRSGPAAPVVGSADPHVAGPRAYDHLEPELRLHATAEPGGPGYDARRERLIREFLPLVHHLARRLSGTGPADDIEQAGVVGLIKAIDRYDSASASRGPLTYLVPCVRGEMLRHLRDHTWSMRVPRGLKDTAVGVNRATDALTQRLGRAPRSAELAVELGVPTAAVTAALGAQASYRPASLDASEPTTGRTPVELMGVDDPMFDLVDQRGDLRRALVELPERERTILVLRYYGDQTQLQIADHLGLSQMQISRLLGRTLERLRRRLTVVDPDATSPVVAR